MAANGHTSNSKSQPTKVWQSLTSRCLPPLGCDAEHWWQLTGYQLANMVEAAGYSVERQYETLLFHYHWIAPRLGPAPGSDGRAKWKSLVGIEGSPIEYSWKWNTVDGQPDIRYSWEPSDSVSGTALDPLNHSASLAYMHDVRRVVPDADFTWAHQLREKLFDHNLGEYAKETENGKAPSTTFIHAVEYVRTGIVLKSYFIPRRIGQNEPYTLDQWDKAVRTLGPENKSWDTTLDFVRKNLEGRFLRPLPLAMDDVPTDESRLKLYFTTPHTSFASVRKIMTLDGHTNVPESEMQDLRSFIACTLGLPDDYPEDAEVRAGSRTGQMWKEAEDLVDGYIYFFDIRPGTSPAVPEIKFYLPVRRYGPDDLSIARNLMAWMTAHGHGAYCDRYLRMLECVAEHRGLGNGKGLHTYLSYMFNKKGGDPDIESYFGPEAYHPARFSSREP